MHSELVAKVIVESVSQHLTHYVSKPLSATCQEGLWEVPDVSRKQGLRHSGGRGVRRAPRGAQRMATAAPVSAVTAQPVTRASHLLITPVQYS